MRPEHCSDLCGCGPRILVLPEPEHSPSLCLQQSRRVRIALSVGLELRSPPVCVVLRRNRMGGATVPEATVDEDGHLGAWECDVDGPSGTSGNGELDAIAQSHREEFASKGQLRRSVAPGLGDHPGPDLVSWCLRRHPIGLHSRTLRSQLVLRASAPQWSGRLRPRACPRLHRSVWPAEAERHCRSAGTGRSVVP